MCWQRFVTGVEVAIGSATTISEVAISNGHCIHQTLLCFLVVRSSLCKRGSSVWKWHCLSRHNLLHRLAMYWHTLQQTWRYGNVYGTSKVCSVLDYILEIVQFFQFNILESLKRIVLLWSKLQHAYRRAKFVEMGLPIQDQPAVQAYNVMVLIASNLEVSQVCVKL